MQLPLHETSGAVQPGGFGMSHTPLLQAAPPSHFLPQRPQLFESDETSTQPASQSTWPVEQVQAPAAQVLPEGQL